jgi:hypothetical protein
MHFEIVGEISDTISNMLVEAKSAPATLTLPPGANTAATRFF